MEQSMVRRLRLFAGDNSGVAALEYAVLAGIVVSALILAAVAISGNNGLYSIAFQSMWNKISSVTSGT
jgi:Flp pilus assembly pilin Flp